MPVTFKGDSEYHTHYKWLDSPKSASFLPTQEQSAPVAGLSSPNSSFVKGFQNEPALLRKKKPLPLMTTSTTKMFDEEIVVPDDYMLLGSQEKFSSNIPYRDYLTKNRTRVLGTTYVAPPVDDIQPQPSRPLAKINFDTGAPKRKDEAAQTEVNGTAKPINPSRTRVIAKEPTSPVLPSSKKLSDPQPPAAPVADMSKTRVISKSKSSKTQLQAPPAQVSQEPVHSKSSHDKSARRQDENIDEKYAMRYRAGVAPSRQSGKRKSEYAYKFDWKKPINSTPLLAADQIVHNSNPQIGPYKDKALKRSEYQKEFKEWKYKPVVSQQEFMETQLRKNIRSSKMRRSRSENNLTPDRRPAAGSPSRIHHDNQRLTQSLNPQKPFFPVRRTVSWTSEYKSNFQPFGNYQYDHGAWKGAVPPHIIQQRMVEPSPVRSESASWFGEVRELRDKAEEYRKRSMGTHFSRAHVAQLISANSQLWDAVSVSSELSALDLEQSKAYTSPEDKQKVTSTEKRVGRRRRTQSAQPNVKVPLPASSKKLLLNESVQTGMPPVSNGPRKRLAWSSDGGRSTSPSDSVRSIRSSSSHASDLASVPTAMSEESLSSANGRVQTPEIVEAPMARRHHLDITTPNRHGLLLSSPPHSLNSSFSQPYTSPATQIKQPAKNKAATQPALLQQKPNSGRLNVDIESQPQAEPVQLSPTYGKPTQDTHALLNEDVPGSVDLILETRYVQSPQPKSKQLSALQEGVGMTYKVFSPKQDPWDKVRDAKRDDDEMSGISQLSNSVMSVISNTSSLASETLERAAKRQKEFWGKTNTSKVE